MGIKTELSHDEFITYYGESEHVKSFSYEAKMAILANIEALQDDMDNPMDVDWVSSFMDASELDNAAIFKQDTGLDVDSMAGDLVTLACSSDIVFEDGLNQILADHNGSDDDVWAEFKDRLLGNSEFYQVASEHIADSNNLTSLDNGKWLMMAFNG